MPLYSTPRKGYRDLIGQFNPDPAGGDAPTQTTYRGNVRGWAYNTNRRGDVIFHIPHDFDRTGDHYVHVHCKHNGTSATGNLTLQLSCAHDVDNRRVGAATGIVFDKTIVIPFNGVPQYKVPIEDFLLITPGGGTGLFNSSLIDIDDTIVMTMLVTGIPTITGGTSALPFIDLLDIHMKSTGISVTKNRAPDFNL